MNSLFVDEATKAKSQVTGSIPADRAVARVNALDWLGSFAVPLRKRLSEIRESADKLSPFRVDLCAS